MGVFTKQRVFLLVCLICLLIFPISALHWSSSDGANIYYTSDIHVDGLAGISEVRLSLNHGTEVDAYIWNTDHPVQNHFVFNMTKTFMDTYPLATSAHFQYYSSSWVDEGHIPLVREYYNFTNADFNGTPLIGLPPLTVQFTDLSTGTTDNWSWVAQSGYHTYSDTSQNPMMILPYTGYYSVSLTTSNILGGSNTTTKINYIDVNATPNINVNATIGNYSIYFSPSDPMPNQVITGTLASTTLNNLKYIQIYELLSGDIAAEVNATNDHGSINYQKSGAIWQYLDPDTFMFAGNLGASTPNYLNFTLPTTGDHVIKTTLIDLNNIQYDFVNTIPVGGAIGQYRLTIRPVDWITGFVVPGSRVNVSDSYGVWTNRTISVDTDCVFPASTGYYVYLVYPPIGSPFVSEVTGLQSVFVDRDTTRTTRLIPTGIANVTTCMVFVTVRNVAELPIGGASVRVVSEGISATTSYGSGTATFNVTKDKNIAITVSKAGYNSATQYLTAAGESAWINVVLTTGIIETGATTIPTPTATYTGAITPGAGGNYTGFWGPEYNLLQAMGATPSYIGLLMTLAIVFAGILIGGLGMGSIDQSFGPSVIGGEAGAISGFILSVAFGWFPAWIVIIAVCVLIVFISIRVWAGGH